ncbi:hypothetical protein JD844_009484 [Phrynosoma platyrhinos]|uniref:Uncharacterized protein n=1 Tax=Phrynosoma platyrhinos TaxID=52577 RepID=A0ABQ7TF81_PHRPL|nr:hypothetical protein JD844_009484 [Phrynosoma platyrhinos]
MAWSLWLRRTGYGGSEVELLRQREGENLENLEINTRPTELNAHTIASWEPDRFNNFNQKLFFGREKEKHILEMLERLRVLIQNRDASVGIPEEGNSSRLERLAAISSASFSSHGQRTDNCRKQTMDPEAKVQGKAPSRLLSFHFCRANKDISVGDGKNTRTLWDCCKNCKINPQGAKPKEKEKQKPESCSKLDRLETHSKTAHHSTAISTTTESTIGSETAISIDDTLESTIPSFQSIQSDHASLLDVEIIMSVMECAHNEEKTFADNNEENIGFLRAISTTCIATLKSGQDTLDLPYTKAELAEVILMIMETLPSYSVPSFTLSCSMLAVYHLSKIKPPLDRELESCILRLTFHGVFSMQTDQGDSHSQALYKSSSDTMETMLKGLLSEVPTTSHLLFILEHISFWIHSHDIQERSRAIKCSTLLLRHAVRLPDFEKSGELPALGHQVAQFGIYISDSVEDVSHYAREAVKYLYQLLLHQMGLGTREAGGLWCQTSENKKMLDYIDTRTVGEVRKEPSRLFGKIFTEDQKRTFLQTSLLSMYDPLRRKSEAGILLVYSLLGKAGELMGDTPEEVEKKIYKQLFKLRTLREVPEALQSDVMLQDRQY